MRVKSRLNLAMAPADVRMICLLSADRDAISLLVWRLMASRICAVVATLAPAGKSAARKVRGDGLDSLSTVTANEGSAVISTVAASADRKSTRLNSSHLGISYAVFCL